MRTIYYTAASLDGYTADSSDSLDWLLQFGEPAEGYFEDLLRGVGALALGGNTYRWILKNQIRPDSESPHPWPYTKPAWVFSSRPHEQLPGANITFCSGNVREQHRKMREVAGQLTIWVMGGGQLAAQFLEEGLLDEIKVSLAPVTLGEGTPILPLRLDKAPLELLSATPIGKGFVDLRYQVLRSTENLERTSP